MNLSALGTSPNQASPFVAPPFVLAVSMLGMAIVLGGPVGDWLGFSRSKQPLPLRKPLSQLHAASLAPYEVVERTSLPPAMVEALGTSEYLKWTLRDTSLSAQDPLRFADVFVTYYTGGDQLVPHVPDECYLGNGYEPAEAHKNLSLELFGPSQEVLRVPIRVCTFRRTSVFQGRQHTVVYTFFANGGFVATRTGVRLRVQNPTSKFAYFSKVEVSFRGASRKQCVDGAGKLFERLLPLLMANHWPDPAAETPPLAWEDAETS